MNGTETGQSFAPNTSSQVSVTGNRTSYLGSASAPGHHPQPATRSLSVQSPPMTQNAVKTLAPPAPQTSDVQLSASVAVHSSTTATQSTVINHAPAAAAQISVTLSADEDVFVQSSVSQTRTEVHSGPDGSMWMPSVRDKQQRSAEIAKAIGTNSTYLFYH